MREGRYPFNPKPGYIRGDGRGIHKKHPTHGPALKAVLIRIATKQVTPSKGLIELNASKFMADGHAPYKMDKFRKIVTDPFYAGIVEMDKQVKVRNENGLHEALISKAQHLELLKIMDGKKKNQGGPRKNGNPEYPLSNHVSCSACIEKRYGRFVGFTHSNGKKVHFYHKYRCRSCKRYITRHDLHSAITQHFQPINNEMRRAFLTALNTVWKQQEGQAVQTASRIRHEITVLERAIAQHVEAITDPANLTIKQDLLASIASKKEEISKLEDDLEKQGSIADDDKNKFLGFAFDFINNIGSHFLDYDLSVEHRVRCKQILFPAGFYLNTDNKVYTPMISPIYGLASNKKDLSDKEKSLLVRVQRL